MLKKNKSVKVGESKEHYEKNCALNIHSPPPFAEKKEKFNLTITLLAHKKKKNPLFNLNLLQYQHQSGPIIIKIRNEKRNERFFS